MDGTEVQLQCPLEDNVDYAYVSWELSEDWDYTVDYDSSETGKDMALTATWSGGDYDILAGGFT